MTVPSLNNAKQSLSYRDTTSHKQAVPFYLCSAGSGLLLVLLSSLLLSVCKEYPASSKSAQAELAKALNQVNKCSEGTHFIHQNHAAYTRLSKPKPWSVAEGTIQRLFMVWLAVMSRSTPLVSVDVTLSCPCSYNCLLQHVLLRPILSFVRGLPTGKRCALCVILTICTLQVIGLPLSKIPHDCIVSISTLLYLLYCSSCWCHACGCLAAHT
jgi:hypothetical protein